MLKTILPCDMKRVEARAMELTGVTGERLMERAAAQVARTAARMLATRGGRVLCLCGAGLNGGDGLAAMRIMAAGDESFAGECWLLSGTMPPDTQAQLQRLASEQPQVIVKRLADGELPRISGAALIIDAMYGTGLSRPLDGLAAALCGRVREARASGVKVLAVDIPSGLSGDTGAVRGAAIAADATVTFHRPKQGLYLRDGLEYTGEVITAPIGIPAEADDAPGLSVLEPSDLAALLPPRNRLCHKGSFGRVLLWVGSRGMAGAAAVAALAALRAGAGLVTVACPDSIVDTVQTLCPCAMCLPLDISDADAAWAALKRAVRAADAVGAGCGLGKSDTTARLFSLLLKELHDSGKPAVLDADALNMLAERDAHGIPPLTNAYITPHPAETARLLNCDTADITRAPLSSALKLRELYGASIVLKGAASVLAAREGMAISPFGSPGMAKGGSGDALTGVLAALLAGRAAGAYRMDDLELAQAACALHGLAGEAAARRHGERGMLATDLCAELGLVGGATTSLGATGTKSATGIEDVAFDATRAALSRNTDIAPHNAITPAEAISIGEPYERADCAMPNDTLASPVAHSPHQPQALRSPVSALSLPSPLGSMVTVTVDRKLGTPHPKHPELIYKLNYGYIQEVYAADNDWQDAYIYGVSKPVEFFEGEVVAVILRLNDAEDKWVVAQKGARPTPEEVRRATDFQERYFDIEIECI